MRLGINLDNRKEKYLDDFKIQNNDLVFRFNISVAFFLFVSNMILMTVFDPSIFSGLSSLISWARMSVNIASIAIFILSFIRHLRKYAVLFGIFLMFMVLINVATVMVSMKNEIIPLNSWILCILIICGIYPIPIIYSSIIYFFALFYFIFFYLKSGNYSNYYFNAVMINGNTAYFVAIMTNFFITNARKNEYYSKKDFEASNKEIAELNEKLKSIDKMKTDFFSNISHEIRTPLTLIQSPIESYLDGSLKVDDMRVFLTDIRNNTQKLKLLINDLLDFSKLDEGRMKLKAAKTDIASFLKNYVHSFKTLAEIKALSLEFFDESSDPEIFIDRQKIDRVFMNLFSNALKFTERGKITVILKNDDKSCHIEFRDTGSGIPEELKSAVFERFYQADSGLNRIHEGTGIGLSLAMEYMKMHGGSITLESNHIKDHPGDHGSVFTLHFLTGKEHLEKMNNVEIISDEDGYPKEFPGIYRTEVLDHQTETGIRIKDDSKPNILVVEDNAEMSDFIVNILKYDYTVITATNGIKAIASLNENDIDLVLSDIMMPEMDGNAMLKVIKSDERFSTLPVIMLTAKTDERMKVGLLEGGANDYITKPFNARELLARMRTQIHLKLLMDDLSEKTVEAKHTDKKITDDTRTKIESAIEYIKTGFSDMITRENLADSLGMSPDHFGRMFKQYTGKKVLDYINDLRLEYASNMLLKSDKKIIEIAMETGFESLRTFNRIFTKKKKMTPSEYRLKGGR
jgi:signal transduction histidine kinase/AraC-like DNA-binding protein